MILLAIWIGTLLAAALVCLLAFVLSWPWWSAAIVSVPCALIGALCLGLWWRSRRRAGGALPAAAPQRELLPLAAREGSERAIRDAMRRLRESGLGRGLRRRSAGPIPWYAVIGDAASGKTSALRASGFELLAAAPPVAGTGGVDIWCSGEAVCWELSGAGLEGGLGAWKPVLEGLAKQRPRRPLDGVIVTVGADQLVTGDAEALGAAARRLRACLDEFEQQLHWVLPVYLLITKVDAVPDFEGFWSRAEPRWRSQPWGATLPERETEGASIERAIAAELELLRNVLHARALQQLAGAEVRDPSALLRFPGRFARFGARLSRYVKALTETRPCRSQVALRGFYLSSAAPSVAEPARQGSLLGETQLASPLPHTARSSPTRSSFLADLFRLAIVPDAHGAARSSQWRRRHGRRQWVLSTGAVAGLLLAMLAASWSYLDNTRLIEATRRDLAALGPASAVAQSEPGSVAGLDVLLASLTRLDAAAARFHVFGWWGPYAAHDLRSAVAQAYRARLTEVARGPLQAQLLATLRSSGDVPRLDWAGLRQAVDHLKLYLMLTHLERLDLPWAAAELLGTWERARQRGAYRDDGPLEPHIARLLAGWADGSLPSWEEDHDMVGRVRARLLGLPLAEMEFSWLEQAARDVAPIRAEQIFTGSSARYWLARGNTEVPGLYTRAGWERIRPLLDTTTLSEGELWVLAPTGTAPGWTSTQLRAHYFERYGRAWRSFVTALRSEASTGAVSSSAARPLLNETIEQLEVLAQGEGPLVRLFQRFGENVRFPLVDQPLQRAVSVASAALGAPVPAAPSPLEEQFRGLLHFAFGDTGSSTPVATSALAEYQNELRTLLAGLRENGVSGAPSDADALLGRASLTVQRLLAPLDNADRSVVQGLLTDPIENGRADARDRDAARLAERWRREVMLPAQRLFARYPFTANAPEDVPLDELQGFLAPKTGSLWRFVDTELAARLSESSGRYDNRALKGTEPLSDDLLECLSAARELRDALFGEDAVSPAVAFAVQLAATGADVSSVAFQVDGESVEGTSAAGKWLSTKWSGNGATPGAVVLIRGAGFGDEIRRMGPWGLMRLLADGELRPSAAEEQILEASWQLNHGLTRVHLQVRPEGSGLSLRPAAFQRLKCPLQPFARHRGDSHDRNSETRSLL